MSPCVKIRREPMATRREKAKAIRSRDKLAQVESLANIGRT
jgi:hypothetical protein